MSINVQPHLNVKWLEFTPPSVIYVGVPVNKSAFKAVEERIGGLGSLVYSFKFGLFPPGMYLVYCI